MKVVTEQSEMAEQAKKVTYQWPFPITEKCRKCKEQTTLMMLVDDNEGLLVEQRPQNVRVWPHDCSAIAIYLCTQCGSMRARWNQG